MDTVLVWLTLGLWLFWMIVYWGRGQTLAADLKAASGLDRALMIVIAAGTAVLMLSGVGIALGLVAAAAGPPVIGLGFVLAVGGMLGTFTCRRALGRFWTAEAALQDDHRVIDDGPYAVVRHPIYTAAIVLYTGTALAFPIVWSWLAAALVIAAYVLKTRLEDVYLAAHLPGYDAYRGRVPWRLIPRLW